MKPRKHGDEAFLDDIRTACALLLSSYAPPYEYLNTGDPYNATLVYKRGSDSLSIGCWGAIAERHPEWE